MFRIKGHRGTSSNFPFIKLLSIQAKISFSHQGNFTTFILPNLQPYKFKYHVSHQGMSSTLIFIKLVTYRLKYNFQDNGHSFTLTLPNTKPNRFRISSFKSRDKFNLPIYQTCKHIGKNLIFAKGSFSIHFTKYKTKQVHISCFTRVIEAQVQTSHLSNF